MPSIFDIGSINPDAQTALLRLNNQHAEQTSWLEPQIWQSMLDMSFAAKGFDDATGLLLAFDQDCDYQGAHFLWFKARLDKFIYIDRIVINDSAQGQGLARQLYETLFATACFSGHNQIVCEVNQLPHNPKSDAFHAKMGFSEMGKGEVFKDDAPLPVKRVAYLIKTL